MDGLLESCQVGVEWAKKKPTTNTLKIFFMLRQKGNSIIPSRLNTETCT